MRIQVAYLKLSVLRVDKRYIKLIIPFDTIKIVEVIQTCTDLIRLCGGISHSLWCGLLEQQHHSSGEEETGPTVEESRLGPVEVVGDRNCRY